MTESPLIKRLLWSGLLAGTGALATLVGTHVATLIWRHVFDEEPPSDRHQRDAALGSRAGIGRSATGRADRAGGGRVGRGRGGGPAQTMAIDEGKKIRETVAAGPEAGA